MHFNLWSKHSKHLQICHSPAQVQAIGMYGAAQPDFFKSETTWDIKIITTHHLYIYKSCVFTQNLEGVTPKISLPRPWEVWNGQGRGSVIFQAKLFKFCGKLTSCEIFNWLKFGGDISKHFWVIEFLVIFSLDSFPIAYKNSYFYQLKIS